MLDTEAEHFDRIQHVNQLAEEIENHRQIIAKLREDIGKYVQCQRVRSVLPLRRLILAATLQTETAKGLCRLPTHESHRRSSRKASGA